MGPGPAHAAMVPLYPRYKGGSVVSHCRLVCLILYRFMWHLTACWILYYVTRTEQPLFLPLLAMSHGLKVIWDHWVMRPAGVKDICFMCFFYYDFYSLLAFLLLSFPFLLHTHTYIDRYIHTHRIEHLRLLPSIVFGVCLKRTSNLLLPRKHG